MRMRRSAWLVLLAAALLLPAPGATQTLDQYGGYRDLAVSGGATGFFRVVQWGNRWVFASPEGHAFWLRSVYVLSAIDGGPAYEQKLGAKYGALGGWPAIFGQQIRRLRAWGFNALDYADLRAWPTQSQEKFPVIHTMQGSLYGAWEGGAVGNLYTGIDAATHPMIYRGNFADVYSPGWSGAVDGLLAYQVQSELAGFTGGLAGWLLGLSTDDGDYTTGFGPGPEAGASQGKTHPHLGWVAAVTAPQLPATWTTPRGTTVTLSDRTAYSKRAWRDYLRARYGTLQALNAAWGASYTSWDSDGGWPAGRGVLDESGRSAWIGTDFDGTDPSRQARPAVWADLDGFLEQLADQYFAAFRAARDRYLPNQLLFTSAPMQAGTRVPILRAAGRYVDAIQSGGVPGGGSDAWYQRACEVSGRPLFLWTTFMAQTDANLKPGYDPQGWGAAYNFPTQAERGAAYERELGRLLELRTADGTACIVGIDWWEWTDKTIAGENMNFGLVSNLDNAYDGREAIRAAGTDPWGFPTGGESRDYGNMLDRVRAANRGVESVLRRDAGRRTHGPGVPPAATARQSPGAGR
jgi:hypothetical protein